MVILSGCRIFAITLNNDTFTIANIAKTYEFHAPSNLLTIKINSYNICDLVAYQLFKKNQSKNQT